ncbi:AraC family transcriptional regulator [Roseateles sp. SL47]|uniref:helix-turn-helix domain-containing protein n=1 Tax=Roseateles sp. SL47 TaxID=2995138 RepID=UPI0022707E8A|nr:AraC family transcriptional regulator [Roseateles sp. SL47]WAC73991.1 AraC family transcriptional regulator [Roseateles sp. SL47]
MSKMVRRYAEPAPTTRDVLWAGERRMTQARDYLAANFHRDVAIEELADVTQLSRAHLTRAFTRQCGVPPPVWLNAVRLSQARRMLLAGERASEVAVACGFADPSHFSRRFKGAMGVPPGAW